MKIKMTYRENFRIYFNKYFYCKTVVYVKDL